jgi:hypothetical protein
VPADVLAYLMPSLADGGGPLAAGGGGVPASGFAPELLEKSRGLVWIDRRIGPEIHGLVAILNNIFHVSRRKSIVVWCYLSAMEDTP